MTTAIKKRPKSQVRTGGYVHFLPNAKIREYIQPRFKPGPDYGGFHLVADLGILEVPQDYVAGKWLTAYMSSKCKWCKYYNPSITDECFPNPTYTLIPGENFHVWAFMPNNVDCAGKNMYDERLKFISSYRGKLLGAQGAGLVLQQLHAKLPVDGISCVSIDKKDRLLLDGEEYRQTKLRMISRGSLSDGRLDFSLANADICGESEAILLFTKAGSA